MMKKNYLSDLNKLALTIFFFSLSWSISLSMPQNNTIVPVNVGVILDDLNSGSAKMWSSCISLALSDFYASHAFYKTRLILNTRESKRSVVGAAGAALDLIKNEQVQAIIGPITYAEAAFVINLGEHAHVPIISFSAKSSTHTLRSSSYFFQFAQNDSSQVKAASAVVKAFGWRQVVPIYIDTLDGRGVLSFLADALQEVGTRIPYLSVISSSATDDEIVEELYKLIMMQTRVFIVHMTTDLCSRLFIKAKEIGMMSEGYVWIITNGITNSLKSMDSSVIKSMEGVIGFETYVQKTTQLEEFKLRWKRQFQKDNATIYSGAELDVFGLWAYDATFALAMAIEQVIGTTSSFGSQKVNVASNNSTDLESFPVSPHGPKLRKAISTTRFQGISGNFILIDGQLQSSNFRIINVNSGGARTIGFWTPHHGIVRKMNSANSTCHLGPVIWPGESLSVPKGWEIPKKGKKLRIGVPVRDGFTEFVKVTIDPTAYTTDVTGFSIDVFKAVVEMLPYALPYEFIPFAKSDGTKAGTYDDLCYQVYLGNFDAAVGDITITANRSLYVDFSMPYSEAGIVMVVPVIDTNKRSALVYLKPLDWNCWLVAICFFLFIGYVVWVLEGGSKEGFQAFSTMLFAHRESVVSNLARFVMIIWIFVLLILTQSWTKSLTQSLGSTYTVEKLKPSVTNIKDLLRKGENIGYIPTAYTYEILKQAGFEDSKLMALGTMEAIDEALSKGSENSGIAAFVDETPYMKLFLARYCNKYTMIGPTYETDGHGYVFPKHSPLLSDVSQATLNVVGGEKILNIENKWFKKDIECWDFTNPRVRSNSLDLKSFQSLFLVTMCVLAFILAQFTLSQNPKRTHMSSVSCDPVEQPALSTDRASPAIAPASASATSAATTSCYRTVRSVLSKKKKTC